MEFSFRILYAIGERPHPTAYTVLTNESLSIILYLAILFHITVDTLIQSLKRRPWPLQQLTRPPTLTHPPLFQHNDPIKVQDCIQLVHNRNRRTCLECLLQHSLHQLIRLSINATPRLIHDENTTTLRTARARQNNCLCPCDIDSSLISSSKPPRASKKSQSCTVRRTSARGSMVLAHAAVEEEGFLRGGADVDSVDGYRAGIEF